MKRYSILIIVLLLSILTSKLSAQEKGKKNLFIDLGVASGEIMKTNDYVNGINENGNPITDYAALDLRFGWQTSGENLWEQYLMLPYYGIGLHSSVFNEEEYFGKPWAAYFFFGGPFIKKPKYSFGYEFNFGMSYNWNPYDEDENPFNVAIGSRRNAYIDLRASYSRMLFKSLCFQAGLRFTHFSNGANAFPNSGLNIVSPFINLRYQITKHQQTLKPIDSLPSLKNKNEFNVLFTFGDRSVEETETLNIGHVRLFCLASEFLWAAGNVFKYGVVTDLGIDGHRNIKVSGDNIETAPIEDQFFWGATVAGQFRADKLAVQAEVGLEFIHPGNDGIFNSFYQRIGLRYYIANKVILGVRIKATDFSVADYVEWSVGYSF